MPVIRRVPAGTVITMNGATFMVKKPTTIAILNKVDYADSLGFKLHKDGNPQEDKQKVEKENA